MALPQHLRFCFSASGGLVGPGPNLRRPVGCRPICANATASPRPKGASICSVFMIAWAVGSPLVGGLCPTAWAAASRCILGGRAGGVSVGWLVMLYLARPAPDRLRGEWGSLAGLATGGMIITFRLE